MNDTARNVNDLPFEVQSQILNDPTVSDEAKLMFCNLMCQDGFRAGWILSDLRWSPNDSRKLHEIERSGYITLSYDSELGARLVQPQRENE